MRDLASRDECLAFQCSPRCGGKWPFSGLGPCAAWCAHVIRSRCYWDPGFSIRASAVRALPGPRTDKDKKEQKNYSFGEGSITICGKLNNDCDSHIPCPYIFFNKSRRAYNECKTVRLECSECNKRRRRLPHLSCARNRSTTGGKVATSRTKVSQSPNNLCPPTFLMVSTEGLGKCFVRRQDGFNRSSVTSEVS